MTRLIRFLGLITLLMVCATTGALCADDIDGSDLVLQENGTGSGLQDVEIELVARVSSAKEFDVPSSKEPVVWFQTRATIYVDKEVRKEISLVEYSLSSKPEEVVTRDDDGYVTFPSPAHLNDVCKVVVHFKDGSKKEVESKVRGLEFSLVARWNRGRGRKCIFRSYFDWGANSVSKVKYQVLYRTADSYVTKSAFTETSSSRGFEARDKIDKDDWVGMCSGHNWVNIQIKFKDFGWSKNMIIAMRPFDVGSVDCKQWTNSVLELAESMAKEKAD